MSRTLRSTTDPRLQEAFAALERGDWPGASALFESHLSDDDRCPEAWEGLGSVAFWLQNSARMFEARQRAYRGYRARGDERAAARVATWLASDFLEFRGEAAVSAGWLARAAQLLEGVEPCAELAWLRIIEAHHALVVRNDPPGARAAARDALRIARTVSDVDHEMLAGAIEGLAMVTAGDVRDGMRRLDASAAAALGGEMADLAAMSVTCCYVIQACEKVRDFGRATEWCGRFEEMCTRWRLGTFLTFCRIQRGTVLLWRGAWREAEDELLAALVDFERVRPTARPAALVRLGELRRRQGRWDEATELFEQTRTHRLAKLWRGALALDQGDPSGAEDAALQALRRARKDNAAERTAALELLVRARIAKGETDQAARSFPELESLAAEIGTDPVRGGALFVAGLLARALGKTDEAGRHLQDAADLLESSGCPFEAAAARLELARVRKAQGRTAAARAQARAALDLYEQLGATRAAEEARDVLAAASTPDRAAASRPSEGLLTPRQREVLRLVAQGLSNRQIGAKLSVSEFTIRRHVANSFERLDVSSRAAAVARALRLGLL